MALEKAVMSFMQINQATVEKIAGLAKLSLDETEKTTYRSQLTQILDYMTQLEQVDTRQVKPLSHVQDISNVFAADQAQPSHAQDKFLANAPTTHGPFYQVPKIIKDTTE